MKIRFDTRGNVPQKECAKAWCDDTTLDIVFGGAKGGGKSFLGNSLIFGDAFTYPGTHYYIARKNLNDLIKSTIPSIMEVFGIWGITDKYYKFNGQHNFFTLHNGSKIFLLGAEYSHQDPSYARFGSAQYTRGWIEEAGDFDENATLALMANTGRWKNKEYGLMAKTLQTCNPSKNYLFKDYYMPAKMGTLPPHKKFIRSYISDNKMLDESYEGNQRLTLSAEMVARLIDGDWEFLTDPLQIMEYVDILNLFSNSFVVPDFSNKYIIADIAYEGADRFVIGVWHGLVLTEVVCIDKVDDTLVPAKIHELRMKYNVPISNVAYDANGLKVHTRQSTKTGHLEGAKAIYNNGKALNGERYASLKAQMYFKLAQYVKENKIYIGDKVFQTQIIEELQQIKKTFRQNDTDKHDIEKKSEIKKRLLRSPDFADMIAYRMFFELTHFKSNAKSWAGAFV